MTFNTTTNCFSLGTGLFLWLLLISPAAAQKEEPLLRLEAGGPTSFVTAMAFSPDGKRLYAGGWDKVVRVWNLDEATGKFVLDPRTSFRTPIGPGLDGAVNALAISPDGKRLAVAGKGVVRGAAGFRDLGRILPTLGGYTNQMRLDEGVIYVFDTTTGDAVPLRGHYGPVLSLSFTSDQQGPLMLASAGHEWNATKNTMTGAVRLWDVNKVGGKHYVAGKVLPEPKTRPGVSLWRVGKGLRDVRVALAWGDGRFRLWAVGADRLIDAGADGQHNNAVAWAADRSQAITGSFGEGGGRLRLWNIRSGKPVRADDERRITFPSQNNVHFVPRTLTLLASRGAAVDHAVASVLQMLEGGKSQVELRVVDMKGRKKVSTILWNTSGRQLLPITAASPKGQFLAAAGGPDHAIHIFKIDDLINNRAAPQRLTSAGTAARQATFVRNGDQLGVALGKDAATLQPGDLIMDAKQRRLSEYRPADGWKLAAAKRGAWKIEPRRATVDAKTQVSIAISNGAGITSTVRLPTGHEWSGAEIFPHAKRPLLAVASHDRGQPWLGIYSAATGEHLRQLTGHSLPIRSLAFSDDGRLLATSSEDQTVAVWSMTDLDQVWGKKGILLGVAVKKQDASIVVGEIQDDSPWRDKFREGDVLAGVAVNGAVRAWKSPRDFYDFFWNAKPGAAHSLRASRAGKAFQLAVTVGQGIDERKPLFTLFVSRPEAGGVRHWIGWSPLGPYDAGSRQAEQLVGWHFNAGDPLAPATFARIEQYRDRYYRRGLLESLIREGRLPPKPRPARLSRPTMALTIPELGDEAVAQEGEQVVEELPVTFELAVFDFPAAKIAGVRLEFDGAAKGDFQLAPDLRWTAAMPQGDWKRGVHRVRAVLRTGEKPPQSFAKEL
ncbi:MAG: hypothetical protein N2C14_19235, partial [Planctomycetales bacterium]